MLLPLPAAASIPALAGLLTAAACAWTSDPEPAAATAPRHRTTPAVAGDPAPRPDLAARFDALDLDGDGHLDLAELARADGPDRVFVVLLERRDANGDERLSRDEALHPSRIAAAPPDAARAPRPATFLPDLAYRPLDPDEYGDPRARNLAALDLYLPALEADAPPSPLVVMVHGGGWRRGDKAGRRVAGTKADHLNARGFALASVNHRLSPAVRHPVHVEDVLAAIAWLREQAAEHRLDPDRIVLMGHSAGAHLAALAAVDEARREAAGIPEGVILGAILLDGAGYDIPARMATRPAATTRRMLEDAFGTDPAGWTDASPALVVARPDRTGPPPPVLALFVDRPSAGDQSRRLAAAVEAAGGRGDAVRIAGKDHASINADAGVPGDPVTRVIDAFLDRVLAAGPARGDDTASPD